MQDLQELVAKLANAKRYSPEQSLYVRRYRKWTIILLGCGGVALILSVLVGLTYHWMAWPPLKLIALWLVIPSMFFGLVGMMVEPLAMVLLLFRWRKATLKNFLSEIDNDEGHVVQISQYGEPLLKRAQAWLQLKIKRLDSAVMILFGSSAALWTLATITITNIKDAGGIKWLQDTWNKGFASDNWTNTLLLWGIALVFGLTAGVALRKMVQTRYIYQLELIEMALAHIARTK